MNVGTKIGTRIRKPALLINQAASYVTNVISYDLLKNILNDYSTVATPSNEYVRKIILTAAVHAVKIPPQRSIARPYVVIYAQYAQLGTDAKVSRSAN